MTSLSLDEARRLAISAQGLARPRPSGRVDRRHLRRMIDDVGVIQIDSVNVLARSHELVLFARLGPHRRDLLTDAVADGEIYEYWVHEASFVPAHHHHLHRWRTTLEHPWKRVRQIATRRPELITDLERRVLQTGPVTARQVTERQGPKGTWWDWDDPKAALEWLFWHGRISATRDPRDFSRRYDAPERVIDTAGIATTMPPLDTVRRELVMLAARHHGIATLADLADYHRQRPRDIHPTVEALVRSGTLATVEVDTWDRDAYMLADTSIPRRVTARALLSPFDPLIWCRPRVERLFGFHYRLEFYTPAARRRFGYFVMPFLLDDQLVARVDLRADRSQGRLVVAGVFAEDRIDHRRVGSELAAELVELARWLDLTDIEVGDRGTLHTALRDALG